MGSLSSFWKRWQAWRRQRRFPREWRISTPPWPSEYGKYVEELVFLLKESVSPREPSAVPIPEEPPGKLPEPEVPKDRIVLPRQSVAVVGTHLFQMRELLQRKNRRSEADTLRLVSHHASRMWDELAEVGLQIHDHTGEFLPETGACELKILDFQPTSGVAQSVVLETIKPSIWYSGQLIQRGEIVVATPIKSAGK